jgi:hypothetical protein
MAPPMGGAIVFGVRRSEIQGAFASLRMTMGVVFGPPFAMGMRRMGHPGGMGWEKQIPSLRCGMTNKGWWDGDG